MQSGDMLTLLRGAGDYFGPVVTLARRITSMTPTRAVYADTTTRDALWTDGQFVLGDVGPATMKGVGPHQVWEVRSAGRTADTDAHATGVTWQGGDRNWVTSSAIAPVVVSQYHEIAGWEDRVPLAECAGGAVCLDAQGAVGQSPDGVTGDQAPEGLLDPSLVARAAGERAFESIEPKLLTTSGHVAIEVIADRTAVVAFAIGTWEGPL